MIAVQVEKEIKQESRVIGRFTLRQVIFLVSALIIEAAMYYIVRPTVETGMGIGMCIGVIAWYFGFHKKNGIYVEYFVIKKIKQLVYRNVKRTYKTKNGYVLMLNEYYQNRKNADLKVRSKARKIKKMEKRRLKKRSKLKGYA